jgi:hypothetical protein
MQAFTSTSRSDKKFTLYSLSLPWQPANQYCKAGGGDLASILDDHEQHAVMDVITKSNEVIWIGLNDMSIEGSFAWADGHNTSYRNWYSGEPNNGGTAIALPQVATFAEW